jgi:hypothetical protein
MGRTPETFPAPTAEYLSTTPAKRRWARAVHSVRAKGVSVHQNKKQCCRSCIHHDLSKSIQAYAFTYGSQDCGFVWVDGKPMYSHNKSEAIDYIMWNFDDYATATILVEEFEREGFTVRWDGKVSQCVMIDCRKIEAVR